MRFAVFYKKIFIKCLKPLDFIRVWGIFLFKEIDFCALFWTIKTLFSKTGMYNKITEWQRLLPMISLYNPVDITPGAVSCLSFTTQRKRGTHHGINKKPG